MLWVSLPTWATVELTNRYHKRLYLQCVTRLVKSKFLLTILIITSANGISNPNLFFAGQVLCIPGGHPLPISPPQLKYSHLRDNK
ncbi:MAG: LysM peptidoglycan-binding domain-containing protein [Anaerolineales bacterium]